MSFETLSVGLLLVVGLLPLVVWRRRRPVAAWLAAGGCAAAALGLGWAAATLRPDVVPEVAVRDRPAAAPSGDYVSSRACRACHPDQYSSWHDSYHRRMTQVATPEAVIGDFSGEPMAMGDMRYRMQRRGDEFFAIEYEWGRQHEAKPRRVVMTTGSHHMQLYWAESDSDRVPTLLPLAYLREAARWVPRPAVFLAAPSSEHPDDPAAWNRTCIHCHSTAGEPHLDYDWAARPVTLRSAATRVAEFGIACEACHGPGGEHVRRNRDPRRRYGLHGSDRPDPTIVNPARVSAAESAEICGQCHGIYQPVDGPDTQRWLTTGRGYRPGEPLADSQYLVRYSSEPELPHLRAAVERDPHYLEQWFWSDGIVRVSGREYSGLVNTPCFDHADDERRMSCLSCHDLHAASGDPRPAAEWADDQLQPDMRGNAACTQCHAGFAGSEALVAHTGHESDSSGSNCLNCHMSYTTYGLLKAIRSHTVESPTVQASLATGRPNACNQCHLDQTLAWTADRLHERYGTPVPELDSDERTVAASVLWTLTGDAGQRALMAWSMGWEPARAVSGSGWMVPYLLWLMRDDYDAVRFIAARSLRRDPGYAELVYDYVGPVAERDAAVLARLRSWRMDPGEATPGPRVLVGPRGRLSAPPFLRLAAKRDERPIYLSE